MTPQTHLTPHAPLTAPHLTSAQLEALLAPSALFPAYATTDEDAVIPFIAATQENAVILAQPESQYLSSHSTDAAAEAHLLLCPACAAELANLRDSLALFRHATTAHADRELQSLPPISVPNRGLLFPALQPAHWFAVAATLLVALLPLQSFRARPMQSAPAAVSIADSTQSQSDAALLDDVDREASASVPASMQTLADPTQSEDTATIQTPAQSPDPTLPAQRKD